MLLILTVSQISAQPKTHNSELIIDSVNCTCQIKNSRSVKFAPRLLDLADFEEIRNFTHVNIMGGSEVYESLHVMDLQMRADKADGYASFTTVAFVPIWITDHHSNLTLCLNPCLQKKIEIPISVSHRHDLRRQPSWSDFDIQSFDSTLIEYTEIVKSLYHPSDADLMKRYLMATDLRPHIEQRFFTNEELKEIDLKVDNMVDSFHQNQLDVEQFLFDNFIQLEPSDSPMSRDEFRRLQLIYAPRKNDRFGHPQIDELSYEFLTGFVHPHYRTYIDAEWMELKLNPRLLSKRPNSISEMLSTNDGAEVKMLLKTDRIVFDNEKGWQQANIPVLHTPISVSNSGLLVRIDSLDMYFEGKVASGYAKKSNDPFLRVAPNGSRVDAWARLSFVIPSIRNNDSTLNDDERYSSDTIILGDAKVSFNNSELFGVIWLHEFQPLGEPYSDLKFNYTYDQERYVFDKLIFDSAIKAIGGKTHYEQIGTANILRFWIPGTDQEMTE